MKNAEHLSLREHQAHFVKADQVFVESGGVWLTQSGQPDDVFLFSGQSFNKQETGKVVIQALSADTKVSLQAKPIFSRIRKLIPALSNAAGSMLRYGLCHCRDKAGGAIQ